VGGGTKPLRHAAHSVTMAETTKNKKKTHL
jgi:hypothetical protein